MLITMSATVHTHLQYKNNIIFNIIHMNWLNSEITYQEINILINISLYTTFYVTSND